MSEPSALPALPSLPERRSVRSHVTQALRAALVAGQLRAGQLYSAPYLAAQLGTSATPVREAMLDLVKEGLVEVVLNKGFRVRELSDRDLDEITGIRRLLEVPTTVELAGSVSQADLDRLQDAADDIVECARVKDLLGYLEADRRFHLGLLELSGNARLVTLVGELRDRSRLYGLESLADSGELVASASEHRDMLRLIAVGDGERLRALISRHIDHVRGSWAGR